MRTEAQIKEDIETIEGLLSGDLSADEKKISRKRLKI